MAGALRCGKRRRAPKPDPLFLLCRHGDQGRQGRGPLYFGRLAERGGIRLRPLDGSFLVGPVLQESQEELAPDSILYLRFFSSRISESGTHTGTILWIISTEQTNRRPQAGHRKFAGHSSVG